MPEYARRKSDLVNSNLSIIIIFLSSFIHNEIEVGYMGPTVDLSYKYHHLGDSTASLENVKSSQFFKDHLSKAKKPMIILGSSALQRADGAALFARTQQLCSELRESGSSWCVLNVLHRVASQVAALDIGYKPGVEKVRSEKPKVLFLLHADNETVKREDLGKDCVVIYQGDKCFISFYMKILISICLFF